MCTNPWIVGGIQYALTFWRTALKYIQQQTRHDYDKEGTL